MGDGQYTVSRSEQKRRAKDLEKLAAELCALPDSEIAKLPCDPLLREAAREAKGLKAGARKRQIKYAAKSLREIDAGPVFEFLSNRKGSKLKENRDFHILERLRDDILNDAIEAYQLADENDIEPNADWPSSSLRAALDKLPDLHEREIRALAERFARTRKPALRRELFRILKAAHDRLLFRQRSRE